MTNKSWTGFALLGAVGAALVYGVALSNPASTNTDQKGTKMAYEVTKTDAEWRKVLSPNTYQVTRQAGTEPPFNNAYWNNHAKGTYICADCGQVLFKSDTKFDSGTGWPSFFEPVKPSAVADHRDNSFGMDREEVVCSRCGAHLGHVFEDGPAPTGLRYCMNSASLDFVADGQPIPAEKH